MSAFLQNISSDSLALCLSWLPPSEQTKTATISKLFTEAANRSSLMQLGELNEHPECLSGQLYQKTGEPWLLNLNSIYRVQRVHRRLQATILMNKYYLTNFCYTSKEQWLQYENWYFNELDALNDKLEKEREPLLIRKIRLLFDRLYIFNNTPPTIKSAADHLQLLINSPHFDDIFANYASAILAHLTQLGNAECIEIFMNHPTMFAKIDTRSLSWAFYQSGCSDNNHFVTKILQSQRSNELTDDDLISCFNNAIAYQNPNCIRDITNSSRFQTFPNNKIWVLLKEMLRCDSPECLHAFISSERFSQIPIKTIGDGLGKLLKDPRISVTFFNVIIMSKYFMNIPRNFLLDAKKVAEVDGATDRLNALMHSSRAEELR